LKTWKKGAVILVLFLIILLFLIMPDIPRTIEGKIEAVYWEKRLRQANSFANFLLSE
jgi:predicted S18 family serine protease